MEFVNFKDNAFVLKTYGSELTLKSNEYIIPYKMVKIIKESENNIQIQLIDEVIIKGELNKVLYGSENGRVFCITFNNDFDKKVFKDNVELYKKHSEQ